MGVVWTCSFEPDDTGTTLTVVWDASTLMKMLDAVFFHGQGHGDRAGHLQARDRGLGLSPRHPAPSAAAVTVILYDSR